MAVERLANPGDAEWQAWAGDHLARYEYAARLAAGRAVLDAGCGIGYGARLLAAHGAARVVGVDVDEQTVAAAAARFAAPNLAFVRGDCETLDAAPGPFDLACSFENIEHLARPEEFFRAVGRRLAPGGVLLCSTPDRAITPPFVNGRPANPYHVHEWYRDEFVALAGRHFRAVEVLAQVKTYAQARRESDGRRLLGLEAVLDQRAVRAALRLGQAIRVLGPGVRPRLPVPTPGPTEPGGFPVVPAGVADLYGTPWCHFLICREPVGGPAAGASGA